MKNFTLFLVALTLLSGAEAYSIQPKSSIASKQLTQFKKSVGATFAAAAIAANVFNPVADAAVFEPTNFGSSNIIAEKEIRQGVYKEYEIDVTPQNYESAESTFKSAKETKSKKGECEALGFYYAIFCTLCLNFNLHSSCIHLTMKFCNKILYEKANTLLFSQCLWLDPLSSPWLNTFGMFGMMILRISSSLRKFLTLNQSQRKRRDGSTNILYFIAQTDARQTGVGSGYDV